MRSASLPVRLPADAHVADGRDLSLVDLRVLHTRCRRSSSSASRAVTGYVLLLPYLLLRVLRSASFITFFSSPSVWIEVIVQPPHRRGQTSLASVAVIIRLGESKSQPQEAPHAAVGFEIAAALCRKDRPVAR